MFGSFSANNANNNAPTGGGIFGAPPQQQQQPQGGGLFGSLAPAQNQQTQSQPATSIFGNPLQPQPTQPSLFGSTNTNANTTPSGGLFGGQASNTGGQSTLGGQQPATSGGAFGNQQSTTSSNPLFGNKTPSSIFGSNININTNTGSNTSTNPAPNPLFGGQQAPSNFFAQPPASQSQQQQAKPTGSIFGSLGQSTTTNTNTNNTNSLFGGGNNSTLNTSALGVGQQQQPQGGSLFGSSTTPGGFGQSTLGGFGATIRGPSGSIVPQGADAQAQFEMLKQRIEGVEQAWNPASPACRFQHYFYNLVDPAQVSLYGRPPNATNEELWKKAVRENPDPTCLVPVLAIGFDDIQQRVEAQSQQAAAHQEKIKELKQRLDTMTQHHDLSNTSRILRASAQQTQLTHRMLALIQHLHLLIPMLRSSGIRREEEELRGELEEIEEEVKRGKGRGKIGELWALVGAVNAIRERTGGGDGSGRGEWAVVDEEGVAQIAQILSEQQAGLVHLTKILQRDMKDLGVILGNSSGGSGEGAEETSYDAERDSMRGSTSILRASALR